MSRTVCEECGSEPIWTRDRSMTLSGHVDDTPIADRCSNRDCLNSRKQNHTLAGWTKEVED